MLRISCGWQELIKAMDTIFDAIEKCVVSSLNNLFKSEKLADRNPQKRILPSLETKPLQACAAYTMCIMLIY